MDGNGASSWRVYCGAHTHVSLVSDGDQGECGTEFTFTDDDPVCPSEWVPCPKCGADCEVLRTPEYRISSGAPLREFTVFWKGEQHIVRGRDRNHAKRVLYVTIPEARWSEIR